MEKDLSKSPTIPNTNGKSEIQKKTFRRDQNDGKYKYNLYIINYI